MSTIPVKFVPYGEEKESSSRTNQYAAKQVVTILLYETNSTL